MWAVMGGSGNGGLWPLKFQMLKSVTTCLSHTVLQHCCGTPSGQHSTQCGQTSCATLKLPLVVGGQLCITPGNGKQFKMTVSQLPAATINKPVPKTRREEEPRAGITASGTCRGTKAPATVWRCWKHKVCDNLYDRQMCQAKTSISISFSFCSILISIIHTSSSVCKLFKAFVKI